MGVTITPEMLKRIAPNARPALVDKLAPILTRKLPLYQITSINNVAHFLAHAAHETDNFRVLEEYASGRRYEGRVDLGNVEHGDGVRFKGRGIFQLTGRANYRRFGERLGLDLVNKPELAADPEVCVDIACLYWNDRRMGAKADRDDIVATTKAINGGLNGFEDRKRKLAAAKKELANAAASQG
jgi:putative chitinase